MTKMMTVPTQDIQVRDYSFEVALGYTVMLMEPAVKMWYHTTRQTHDDLMMVSPCGLYVIAGPQDIRPDPRPAPDPIDWAEYDGGEDTLPF